MGIAQHRTRRRQIRWAELFQIIAVDKRKRLPSQFVYSAQVVIFGSNGLVTEANLKFMTASSVVGVIPMLWWSAPSPDIVRGNEDYSAEGMGLS